jgi:hypothetical protein
VRVVGRGIDEEVVFEVCRAPFRGVSRKKVIDAVMRKNRRHDLRVAYEIILDAKQAKARTAEVMLLMQVGGRQAGRPRRAGIRARGLMCCWVWCGLVRCSNPIRRAPRQPSHPTRPAPPAQPVVSTRLRRKRPTTRARRWRKRHHDNSSEVRPCHSTDMLPILPTGG